LTDGTLQEDLERRDFTIIAMAISLIRKILVNLVDPFGDWLISKRSPFVRHLNAFDYFFRTIPLRIARAVRFASQLDFDIEPDTFFA